MSDQEHITGAPPSPSVSEELISPVTTTTTTDSMVTVPLSDRQSTSENASTGPSTPTTPVDETGGQNFDGTEKETDLTPKNNDIAAKVDEPSTEENKTQPATPVEAANTAGDTQETNEPASSTENDGGVDWEKLDNSEKQEPRTEATDEVSLVGLTSNRSY